MSSKRRIFVAFTGREVGAIGVVSMQTESVDVPAESKIEVVEQKLYEKFEHITELVVLHSMAL